MITRVPSENKSIHNLIGLDYASRKVTRPIIDGLPDETIIEACESGGNIFIYQQIHEVINAYHFNPESKVLGKLEIDAYKRMLERIYEKGTPNDYRIKL